MPAKLQPQKFSIQGCTKTCSVNVGKLPPGIGDAIHQFYEAGNNDKLITEKAKLLGVKLSEGAIGRHRANHLVPQLTQYERMRLQVGEVPERVAVASEPTKKVTDLDVLEAIISKGASGIDLATVRISPEMTIRAIELKYKLTQGSAFEGFLAAIGGTMEEVTGRADEPEVASEEEQEQAVDEDVPVG